MPDYPAWWEGLGPDFHAAIRLAEFRGQMSFIELDTALPDGHYTSKHIEITLDFLGQRGIQLVEG